jgi:hypothetical protein
MLKLRIWWYTWRVRLAYMAYLSALYDQPCGHTMAVQLPSVRRLRDETNRRLKKLVAIDPNYKGPTQVI